MAKRITGPELKDMREWAWPLMSKTRDRATEARQLLAGELGIELPEEVTLAGADAWVGDTPHRLTGPQQVRQDLIAKQYEIQRPRMSGGQRAASVASRIEQPLQSIMQDEVAGFPWEAVNDVCVFEGIVFGTVSVTLDEWRKFDGLYSKKSGRFTGVEHMDARYAVDGEGRFRGDDGYDPATVDTDRAVREHKRDFEDHQARHLPFRQDAWSIRSCAPIFGGNQLNPRLDGLIIESFWSQFEFRRKGMYVSRSETDTAGENLYPLGAVGEADTGSTFGKMVKVIEAWLVDDDGIPYLSYCVEGADGKRLPAFRMKRDDDNQPTGDYEEYVVDLSRIAKKRRGGKVEWCGFTRLPVSWGFGLGWSTTDLDKRSLPYTKPFQQGWRNFDMLMSTAIATCVWMGFPALVEKVAIAALDDENLDEKKKATPDIRPLKITQVTGDVTNIGGQSPSPAVFELMRMALGENKAEQAGGDTGEGGGASGFALTLQEALKQNALTTVNQTVLKMASMHASFILEGAKAIGEAIEPVLVYKLPDVLLEQEHPSDTGKPMPLSPELIGTNYDVKAIAKKVPGENPAKRQQDAALVKEGFYDNIWFLEEDGYPAPEEMAARVAYQQMLQSPEGQQATFRMLSQYVRDEWVQQIMDAIAAQQANEQGLPVGFGDGTTPPPEQQAMLEAGPQATAGLPGLGTPNPAASALAGQVGGGLQNQAVNNAIQGGGELPPGYTGSV